MKFIAIACDHAGLDAKIHILLHYATQEEFVFEDYGTYTHSSCDYPVFGKKAAKHVANGDCEYGIVICGTGIGISMAANKVKGIRCAVGYSDQATILSRKHNDANMIAFGARTMTVEEMIKRIDLFLHTEFEGGRHQKRVNLIEK
ncbi:MAG: ribose 5-phosphate isomerase B [Coprobacillus sp.]|nr:ribose 5-phosphate isomerase B [Coprobacillus sp.]